MAHALGMCGSHQKKVANFASEGKLLRSDKCSSPKIWKSGHNKPTHIVHRLTTLVFQNN